MLRTCLRNGDLNAGQSAALWFGMIEMTWLSALLIGAGCFALGCLIGARRSSRAAFIASKDAEINDGGRKKVNRGKPPLEVEKLAEIIDDFKMVLFKFLFFCMFVSVGIFLMFEFMIVCGSVIECRFWL